MEAHGGLDLLDKCMRKGVGDSNPAARTKSREAFWIFHRYWPDQANTILNSLDPSTKKQVAALAPADVETDAIVEQKPKAGGGPVRARPGGASMALIQAKKAAAAKAVQERERKKAEDAAAAHEARVAAARAALVEQQQLELQQQQYQQHQQELQRQALVEEHATPVANHKKSAGFMPIRNRPQPSAHAANLKPSTELSVLVSPTAHQRIETAISVPLPTSPTPVGMEQETPRHASVQHSSPSLTPGVARHRAISSSSFSSQGSGSASSSSSAHKHASSTPRSHHFNATRATRLDADLHNLSLTGFDDADETADATQQPRFMHHSNGGEDDTVQLSAPEDASMDLMGMNFNSPFRLPVSASKTQIERQNALDSLQSTPQAKTQRTASSSSASSGYEGTTPGSAVRRSGLPRPVSMMHSPSPHTNGRRWCRVRRRVACSRRRLGSHPAATR